MKFTFKGLEIDISDSDIVISSYPSWYLKAADEDTLASLVEAGDLVSYDRLEDEYHDYPDQEVADFIDSMIETHWLLSITDKVDLFNDKFLVAAKRGSSGLDPYAMLYLVDDEIYCEVHRATSECEIDWIVDKAIEPLIDLLYDDHDDPTE